MIEIQASKSETNIDKRGACRSSCRKPSNIYTNVAQKLWEKSVQVNKDIERFTVGRDREMDLYLAKYDVLGSMAHITMLETIGLLTKD